MPKWGLDQKPITSIFEKTVITKSSQMPWILGQISQKLTEQRNKDMNIWHMEYANFIPSRDTQ